MKLKMDPAIIAHIIEHRFDGKMTRLIEAWDVAYAHVEGPGLQMPNRAAFYRWANGNLPKTATDFMRWAAVLDTDPIALFSVPPNRMVEILQWLAAKFTNNTLLKGPLSIVGQIYTAHALWPADEIVRPYYGRGWHVRELTHDPAERADYYAAIELLDPNWDGVTPRVYHFAYRRDIPEASLMIPYGTIIRTSDWLRLAHMAPYADTREAPSSDAPTVVGTWFGSGPAIFRIASVHPFTADVGADRPPEDMVRFIK